MKTYTIDIYYFDSVEWLYLHKEIVATSMFQLMRTFIKEVEFMTDTIWDKTILDFRKKTKKELWVEAKETIIIEELTFPIVRKL